MAKNREGILDEINGERDRQDQQWGGPEKDDKNSIADWRSYRQKFEQRIVLAEPFGKYQEIRAVQRDALIKIAALAVAQIEALDGRGIG